MVWNQMKNSRKENTLEGLKQKLKKSHSFCTAGMLRDSCNSGRFFANALSSFCFLVFTMQNTKCILIVVNIHETGGWLSISIENAIELSSWIIMLILLWRFVPKEKIRQAHVAFLIMQVLTWFIGFLVVELKMIEYPIRFFDYASRTSFTYEYFVFPAICVLFNVHYPETASLLKKILYYLAYLLVLTIIEISLEKHTLLIKYLSWDWYWTFISTGLTLFLSRKYLKWFFR